MAKLDKYNLPHVADKFSSGKIGSIEHLIVKIGNPVTGGSMAMIGALEIWTDKNRTSKMCIQYKHQLLETFEVERDDEQRTHTGFR